MNMYEVNNFIVKTEKSFIFAHVAGRHETWLTLALGVINLTMLDEILISF